MWKVLKGYDIVLGLNWIRQTNPHVNGAMSTLVFSRKESYHKDYLETIYHFMKDHIFLKSPRRRMSWKILSILITTPLSLSVSIYTEKIHQLLTFTQIIYRPSRKIPNLQEKFPKPPSHCYIKHIIELKGIIKKARFIYKMTPTKDNALKAHLINALEKGLIWAQKYSYRAAVFFFF